MVRILFPPFSSFFLAPPPMHHKSHRGLQKNEQKMGLHAKNLGESRVRELCLLCFNNLV
jgi:hypothetical protein